jgi:hypothetical protein
MRGKGIRFQETGDKRRTAVFYLVLAICFLPLSVALAGCTLGEAVMPNPASGLAAGQSIGLAAPVPVPIPHTLDGREQCFTCHDIGAVDAPPVPAGHEEDVELCTTCHAVWLAPAIAAIAAPAIPHDVVGYEDCLMCHKMGVGNAPRRPDNHNGLESSICQACHTSVGEGESEGAPPVGAPLIPHPLEGYESCIKRPARRLAGNRLPIRDGPARD